MVTLGVDDLPRAVRFYEQGLGFPRMDSPPEVAFFTLNGSWLGLYGRKDLAEDARMAAQSPSSGFPGFSLAHNVHSDAEVDAVLAQAAAAGATITKPAEKTSWGGYAGYFADPEGYLWVGPKDETS
jgi:catechol 2,3-dioxygenase-like lactoylglutathione lyase family enzyme